MRMFLYYAGHSFINQIKKIFKTWIMVFIVICFAFGLMIGGIAAFVSNLADKNKEETAIEEMAEQPETEEIQESETAKFSIRDTIGAGNFMELLAAGLVMITFALSIVNADKNAGKIFLPADVTILFPSPLKPQSVMLFRIGMTMGTMLLLGVYMLFQMPNLVLNMGLTFWAALAAVVAFSVTTFLGTLVQLLAYLTGSKYAVVRKYLRPALIAVLALVGGGYVLYKKNSGLSYLEAASGYFNANGTRLIPFWGWMKGFVSAAVDGDPLMAFVYMLCTVAGAAGLIVIIWNLKVDFYEDAMAKSEEVAAMQEAIRSNNAELNKRKKDRSEKLQRDGLKRGFGANVYFFKNMYNRRRFAHLGFFTKTMEVYLCVAVGLSLVLRNNEGGFQMLIVAAVFTGLAFMRSLGNVLEQDTKMEYFVLIPESAWAKMFYSYMAELVSTALDLGVPMLLATFILGENPLITLALLAAALSVNTYSCSVGTFIGITVPVNAAATLKQFVQIMFVYFGLLPDILAIAICAVLGNLVLGIVLAVITNLLLGALFFSLAAVFRD